MSSTPNDRKAKAQAAAKVDHGGGPNRILVSGLVAVVALAAIIAGTIFATRSGSGGGGGGAQALPTGTERGEGIVVNADEVKGKDVPTVDVYEDFRCPVCKVYEVGLGKTTQELAEEGKIKLVVHLKTVIDSSLGGDASKVAASTAVCAAEQGKWFEYHEALFAKQDPQEGPFADGAFGEAAQEAGITGADRVAFDQCVADQRYTDYVESVDDASSKRGINATPVIVVNGTPYNWASTVNGGDQQNPQFDTEKYAKVLTSGKVAPEEVNDQMQKDMAAAQG